jgi:hypothetical protein
VPIVDSLGDNGIVETGRLAAEDDAFRVNVETRLVRVAVKELQAECMQCRQERHIRGLSQSITQSKRAIGRELGHQPVGDRLGAFLFLSLILRD